MSKPIELQKGDKVRDKGTGRLGTVITNLGHVVVRVRFAGSTSGYEIVDRDSLRFVSRPKATDAKPKTAKKIIKVGDRINVIGKGALMYTYVYNQSSYANALVTAVDSHSVRTTINGDHYWFLRSEVELAPKTTEVAIDVNTNSIESMEKALKEIDSQRDILADKLLAKKKEERAKMAEKEIAKMAEKEISDMVNSIKSQSGSIQIRTNGIFKGKGVYLSSHYNWEIKVDEYGIKVLVPTMVAIVPTKP